VPQVRREAPAAAWDAPRPVQGIEAVLQPWLAGNEGADMSRQESAAPGGGGRRHCPLRVESSPRGRCCGFLKLNAGHYGSALGGWDALPLAPRLRQKVPPDFSAGALPAGRCLEGDG
jgi:hypothetical protein